MRLHAIAGAVAFESHQITLDVFDHGFSRQQPSKPGGVDPMALEGHDLTLSVALVQQGAAVRQTRR
ncbi:MAG: hypothetical protein H0W48_02150 [Methylibium sp.]|nr:hypothetical protein [Methylibium sp.]